MVFNDGSREGREEFLSFISIICLLPAICLVSVYPSLCPSIYYVPVYLPRFTRVTGSCGFVGQENSVVSQTEHWVDEGGVQF